MLELFKSQIICRGFESFVPHINQLHVTVIEKKGKKISQVTVLRTFCEILVKDKPKRNTK